MPTAVVGVGFSPAFVRLFVCLSFPHDISKLDASRIIKCEMQMFHDES